MKSSERVRNALCWATASFYVALAVCLMFVEVRPPSYGAILMSWGLAAYFAPPVRRWVTRHTPLRYNGAATVVVAVLGFFGLSMMHSSHLAKVARSQGEAAPRGTQAGSEVSK